MPPLPGRPVFCFSGGRLSVTPSGTRQANSPVLTLTAVNCPQGGCWHGNCCGPLSRDAEASAARHTVIRTIRIDAVALPGGLRLTGRLGIAIHETRELPELAGVDEQVAEMRIERRAAPVDAAMVAGELHAQALVADRKVRPAQLHALRSAFCRPLPLPASRSRYRPPSSSCATSGGGLSGNGCVFDVRSSGTSLCGTGRSSTP